MQIPSLVRLGAAAAIVVLASAWTAIDGAVNELRGELAGIGAAGALVVLLSWSRRAPARVA